MQEERVSKVTIYIHIAQFLHNVKLYQSLLDLDKETKESILKDVLKDACTGSTLRSGMIQC